MAAAHQVYHDQLYPYKHGLPLWFPEPAEHGDVGFMHEGSFRPLFNILRPEGHPGGNSDLPPDFTTWQCPERLRRKHTHYLDGPICSRSVKTRTLIAQAGGTVTAASVGAGFSFSCSRDQGAVLVLHDPADYEGIMPNSGMERYMFDHQHNWHKYMKDSGLGDYWDDLLLVTGTVKTSAWMVAAFLGRESSQEFTLSGQSGAIGASAGLRLSMNDVTAQSVEHRTGPPEIVDHGGDGTAIMPALGPTNRASLNQCVFLRGYKFRRTIFSRLGFVPPKVIRAEAEPKDLRRYDDDEPGPAITANDGSDEDFIIEHVPGTEHVNGPLDDILDYILERNSESDIKLAIAHTDDIYALCKDHEITTTFKELLNRLSPELKVHEGIGMLEVHDSSLDPVSRDNVVIGLSSNLKGKGRQVADEDIDMADASNPGTSHDGNYGPDSVQYSDEEKKEDNADRLGAAHQFGGIQLLSDTQAGEGCPLSMSPNGEYIATGGTEDSILRIWESNSGMCIIQCSGHRERINSVAYDHKGERIVSGSNDQTAIVWDARDGEWLFSLIGHTDTLWSVAFSPDDKSIATGSPDLSVRLWDASTGALLHCMQSHYTPIVSIMFSPNGKRIAARGPDSIVYLWDTESGAQVAVLDGHEDMVWAMAISPDSRRIITASEDSTCRIWNIDNGDELATIREHSGPVWAVAYSPDGQQVISGSQDSKIAISSTATGELLKTIEGHSDVVHALTYSRSGKYIGSGSADFSTRVWDVESGKQVGIYQDHLGKVNQVFFTPEEDRVISSADDGAVRIWEILAQHVPLS